jgi:hemerythrin
MADVLVEWSDDFLVGNEEIDSQHKELVEMTNEFYAGCQMGGVMAKVYFMKTIQGAVLYVKTHFSTEERIMREVNYPDLDAHKKQHEDFVSAVTRQIQVFEKEDNPNPSEFVKYLMDWILQHIAETDKKYMPFIAKLNS